MDMLGRLNEPTMKTLLSPLGLSPGLLYSALKTIKPDHLVVLTSREGEGSLDGIMRQADYYGLIDTVVVEDPFDCFHQVNVKVKEILDYIVNSTCVVNLTGGTTALQFIIQCAGFTLKKQGYDVHYVALIDRRGIEAQRQDPWVLGELIEINSD